MKSSFGTEDFNTIYKQLIDCLNIKTIEITNGEEKATSCSYKYTLSDSNWKDIQIQELKKGYESHSLR
mgnify:FL=1